MDPIANYEYHKNCEEALGLILQYTSVNHKSHHLKPQEKTKRSRGYRGLEKDKFEKPYGRFVVEDVVDVVRTVLLRLVWNQRCFEVLQEQKVEEKEIG